MMYDFDRMNLHECWRSNRYIAILAHNDGQALAEHEIDFYEFTVHLVRMLDDMIFRQWRQPLAEAMRDYCHIAGVDPALVEAYIGMRFEDIDFQSLADVVSTRTYSKDGRVIFKIVNGIVERG